MASTITVFVTANTSLTCTSSAVSSGHAAELDSSSAPITFTAIPASSSVVLGPYPTPKTFRIYSEAGEIAYSLATSYSYASSATPLSNPIN